MNQYKIKEIFKISIEKAACFSAESQTDHKPRSSFFHNCITLHKKSLKYILDINLVYFCYAHYYIITGYN